MYFKKVLLQKPKYCNLFDELNLNSKLCVGDTFDSACSLNSGEVLFTLDGYLAGISTFSSTNCNNKVLDTFVNINFYLDWINNNSFENVTSFISFSKKISNSFFFLFSLIFFIY
jgi:hypothetical protein